VIFEVVSLNIAIQAKTYRIQKIKCSRDKYVVCFVHQIISYFWMLSPILNFFMCLKTTGPVAIVNHKLAGTFSLFTGIDTDLFSHMFCLRKLKLLDIVSSDGHVYESRIV
jgi:hypothetical protein